VTDIHHAHLWSLDGKRSMITLHARIRQDVARHVVVEKLKARLDELHDIGHATIEIEIEGEDCTSGDCD
jgi:cobalt-zinc-cadmium efflux system protein